MGFIFNLDTVAIISSFVEPLILFFNDIFKMFFKLKWIQDCREYHFGYIGLVIERFKDFTHIVFRQPILRAGLIYSLFWFFKR